MVLTAVCLGFAIVVLDAAALSVAIPDMRNSVGGSLAGLQWVSNAYILTFAAFLLSAGRFADRLGAKRTLLTGAVAFTITSLLCGASPNLPVLIGFRFLQGIAGAVLVTSAFALLAHLFPASGERAKALAMLNLCGSIGLSSGPLLAGVLVDTLSWRWVFVLNIIPGALVVLGLRLIDNPAPQRKLSVDVPGQILGVLALGGLAMALIEGREHSWTAALTVGAWVVFAIAGVGFIAVEHRRRDPMLPLSLFRTHSFTAGSVALGVWRGSLYGLMFFLGFYLQQSHGFGSTLTGLAFIPITAAPLLSNYFSAAGIAHYGSRFVAVSGFGCGATGAALLLIAGLTGGEYWVIGVALALIGLGGGWAIPAVGHAALMDVPKRFSGVAAGVFNACGQSGALVGVALLGSLAGGDGAAGLRAGSIAVGVLFVGTAVLLQVGLANARLGRRQLADRQPREATVTAAD